jgi:hypothetical protein
MRDVGPWINPIFGPTSFFGGYWTSTGWPNTPGVAVVLYFNNGTPSFGIETNGYRARAMRGGP